MVKCVDDVHYNPVL